MAHCDRKSVTEMASDNEDEADLFEAVPLEDDKLAEYADRLERLPLEEAEWVAHLFQECRRARAVESRLLAQVAGTAGQLEGQEQDLALLVLDAAAWLRILWDVGYMGGSQFPATPRTQFPVIELDDVLKSALFARIRTGKRPLPFPPPTRHGVPWHEAMEEEGPHAVEAEILRDENGVPVGAVIEACRHWQVIGEPVAGREYSVQHNGKGPLFRLSIDSGGAQLARVPPSYVRRIRMRERGGFRSFTLEWPRADGENESVNLRAGSWERAEAAAQQWIALNHSELYGQVRFEHDEAQEESSNGS
jgi:hypothetical protein